MADCGLWPLPDEGNISIPINPDVPTPQQITSLVSLREYSTHLVAEQGEIPEARFVSAEVRKQFRLSGDRGRQTRRSKRQATENEMKSEKRASEAQLG